MKQKTLPLGFTLAETVVAILLMSLILLLVLSIYLIAQKSYLQNQGRAELMQNGRTVLDRMERELRQAIDIATVLPADDSLPSSIPHEIVFQDGHDQSTIHYIRYYLDGTNLKRQVIAYYFPSDPSIYVRYDSVDANYLPPQNLILQDQIIGEYVSELDFFGDNIVYIELKLSNNNKNILLMTEFYARNL
jgi:type II secretory pathway pseudopilin PulG